jgi:hypothetical protein
LKTGGIPCGEHEHSRVGASRPVTEGTGTGNCVLSLDSRTSVPPIGAALLSVTVHIVASPAFKLLGLHASWETEKTCPKAVPANRQMEIAPMAIPLYFEKQRSLSKRRRIPYHGQGIPQCTKGTQRANGFFPNGLAGTRPSVWSTQCISSDFNHAMDSVTNTV